jgi:hypothetical protein
LARAASIAILTLSSAAARSGAAGFSWFHRGADVTPASLATCAWTSASVSGFFSGASRRSGAFDAVAIGDIRCSTGCGRDSAGGARNSLRNASTSITVRSTASGSVRV